MEKTDYIENAIDGIKSKLRVMESGTIIRDGHQWSYKIKWIKPRGLKQWKEVYKDRTKYNSYFPDNSKHVPTDPLGKCNLCNAPIFEQTKEELENYCWNCGVKFV